MDWRDGAQTPLKCAFRAIVPHKASVVVDTVNEGSEPFGQIRIIHDREGLSIGHEPAKNLGLVIEISSGHQSRIVDVIEKRDVGAGKVDRAELLPIRPKAVLDSV